MGLNPKETFGYIKDMCEHLKEVIDTKVSMAESKKYGLITDDVFVKYVGEFMSSEENAKVFFPANGSGYAKTANTVLGYARLQILFDGLKAYAPTKYANLTVHKK